MSGAAFTSNTFLIKEFLLMYQLWVMKKIPDFFTLFGLTTPVPTVRFLALKVLYLNAAPKLIISLSVRVIYSHQC